jgi:hypothetical protein
MARKPKQDLTVAGQEKASKSRQPRILSPEELAIQPYFRGSMYAELQKFKNVDHDRQLILGEDLLEDQIEASGLDLTETEDRALHAIQVLLDKTDYKGNIPGEMRQITADKWDGYLPRLSISYSDYYEAYGLQRTGGKRYHGAQAEDALQALKSLAQTRRIAYKRRRWTGNGKAMRVVYDVIRVTRPLISFIEAFKDLEETEAEQVIAGQDLPEKRQTRLIIDISPLLVDQIDTFYLLKPVTLHAEIRQLHGSKRTSRAVSLFIEWLLTKNFQEVKVNKKVLAERLRLDYLIKQRHQDKLEIRIQEALQTAKKLRYLLDYREEPSGLLVLTLNPERIKRIGKAQPGEVTEEKISE